MIFIDIAVSFLIAALAGMGVGTGGLLVAYLTFGDRVSQLSAQGINLLFYLAATLPSACIFLKKKKLPMIAIFTAASFGSVGTLIGFEFSEIVSPSVLRKIFGAMLVASAVILGVAGVRKSG